MYAAPQLQVPPVVQGWAPQYQQQQKQQQQPEILQQQMLYEAPPPQQSLPPLVSEKQQQQTQQHPFAYSEPAHQQQARPLDAAPSGQMRWAQQDAAVQAEVQWPEQPTQPAEQAQWAAPAEPVAAPWADKRPDAGTCTIFAAYYPYLARTSIMFCQVKHAWHLMFENFFGCRQVTG